MQQLTKYSVKDFILKGVSKRGCIICTYGDIYGGTIFITHKVYNRLLKDGELTGAIIANTEPYSGTYTLKVLSAF